MKKWLHPVLCVIISILAIFICLITSFEIAAYSDFGFYQKEYEKYHVLDRLDMEMEDVMDVTVYMMSYLRGGENVLSIEKTIEGEVQDFFNEQDRFHMGEVRELFLGGIALRRMACILLIVLCVILFATEKKWQVMLSGMFQKTLGIFCILVLFLGAVITMNFSECFVIFHEIFFDNDLWIFDSRTDFMIRMLPEGFFYDMVIRIGVIFIISLVLLFVGSVFLKKKVKDK
ncbi:MAG: TIGR01906 family membrane protein [bacterium]|nr:TIGR01906 family membrane protein [bacterium]